MFPNRSLPTRMHDLTAPHSDRVLKYWENVMNRYAKFTFGEELRLLQRSILLIAVTVAAASGAMAQAPGRAIMIVVPTTAGTGPDILARTIGEELQQRWANQSS